MRPVSPQQVIATERPPELPAPKVERPPEGAHYRVLKTDTAKSIAVKFYGDDRYAEDILELNKETIRRARGLKPGTVILLPPVKVRDAVARP
jgi:nucleoid-associated protein YgaU